MDYDIGVALELEGLDGDLVLSHLVKGAVEHGPRMEAGHIGQNIALAAQSLNLGLVTIGAFDDDGVHGVLSLPQVERAYYIIPVGHPG
jgi:hypothetical protein